MTFKPDDDDAHSTLVGGSTASRRINCPGSYQMENALPATVKDQSSSYADEGTALHAAVEFVLRENVLDLDEVVGMEFEGYVMTDELVDNGLGPCVDFIETLFDELAESDGDEPEFELEKRCELPGIPGAFGTSDFIGRTPKRSIIVDWKFGVGVPVKAYYEDEDGNKTGNPQLMFYARAAMHTVPDLFEKDPSWPVDLYIVQPRVREGEPVTYFQTTVGQLEQFRMELVRAIAEAKGANPSTKRGDWCRFAACKSICPHFTGPLLDLTKLRVAAKEGKVPLTGDVLGLLLNISEIAELCIAEIRAVAHSFLQSGQEVKDWKLVDKRASESYVDAEGAVRHVVGMGAKTEDCYEPAVIKSPAQLRAALEPFMEGSTKKARTEAAKEEIGKFTQRLSSGTTLAHVDDKRVAVIPTSGQLQTIADKLSKLLPAQPKTINGETTK